MREFLSEKGVKFVERNIRRDPDARAEVVRLVGAEAVPLTVIGGQVVIGFDRAVLESLLV